MSYAPHLVTLQTPVGGIVIESDDTAVTAIRISATLDEAQLSPDAADKLASTPAMRAADQLRSYFAGELRHFDLPLAAASSVRGMVLRSGIAAIPFGETLTYGQLARALNSSARAIGGACSRNPFPIVVPCHRVTSSGGAGEHYSAGRGPETKSWLIAHEARLSGRTLL